ncbi:hypothetical protein N9T54_00655 [Alphaproteobacteria bacterium]|nr:hypothetical protein [Alphaproteobacteria bacterium]
MKGNILITGASGTIATLIRPLYQDFDVVLISRRLLKNLSKNEINIICPSLEEKRWWKSLDKYKPFDQVLHFSEPVKKNVNIELISKSHIEFLKWACINSKHVTYPLTAYLYDDGRGVDSYVEIKKKVARCTMQYDNIYLPIVHPVIDFGNGLNRLKCLESKIPFINIFCSFYSNIKVVESSFLGRSITLNDKFGLFDIYSYSIEISELFKSGKRKDYYLISFFLRKFLILFSFIPSIAILLHGRDINHDKII